MSMNRIIVVVVIGGGIGLFILSNLSPPVLSLTFLGIPTPALPLTIWVGIAIAAGAITSFILQFLSSLQRGYQSFENVTQTPRRNRWEPRERYEPEEPEPPYTPPPPQPKTQTPASDWEEGIGEDWDFEEEPAVPKSYQEDSQRDRSSETIESDQKSYEVKQEPSTTSTTGSVYSYSYRESRKPGVAKPDLVKPNEIYDANYRVITPPYQKPVEPVKEDDEDEDWGLDDDEDFDFEDDRKRDRS